MSGDLINTTRHLRKALRDVRDRSARKDHRWRAVAMAGLLDANQVLVLIHHPSIRREAIWDSLDRRLPQITICDPAGIEPTARTTVEAAADLARCGRSIEPIRIVVMQQRNARIDDPFGQPMPMSIRRNDGIRDWRVRA